MEATSYNRYLGLSMSVNDEQTVLRLSATATSFPMVSLNLISADAL